jgi:hypothetical protein
MEDNNTPPLKEMVFGLTDAIKDSIQNLVSRGVILAKEEVADKRMQLCLDCEFFIKDQCRCSKCGCFMKVKTRLDTSKCPVNKW